ncbi:unnamed protein product [Danaus chrysippus]|uniref:(African queen) hypothetical protein n=1 Tax=Danaus chrysippus TaxID=151541 RepID=A0A8J2M990_9NEOP|nr:unnamed protein product [Danaus chrysippus]
MEYQHPQPVQPLGPPAPPPQLLPPAPPPPLPSLPQLQHGHVQDDDRWSQYHIWRQHVFVNGQFRDRTLLVYPFFVLYFLRASVSTPTWAQLELDT